MQPGAVILALGVTGSGKSVILSELVKSYSRLFGRNFSRLYLVSNNKRDDEHLFEAPTRVSAPELFARLEGERDALVIFDDALVNLLSKENKEEFIKLVTVTARHERVTTVFALQALPPDNFATRCILENAGYIICTFRNSAFSRALARSVQRNFFPGIEKNFVPRLIRYLKAKDRTYFVIDVAKDDSVLIDLFENLQPSLVEWHDLSPTAKGRR